MKKLIDIINKLISEKFSEDFVITFNQGGIRGAKMARYEKVEM